MTKSPNDAFLRTYPHCYATHICIFIEFGISIKLVTFIKMCSNETYHKVLIGKHLSDTFPIQNGLK